MKRGDYLFARDVRGDHTEANDVLQLFVPSE